MTEANRRENIAMEVARAREALAAARLLVDGRLFADSVSRAYYGMLHWARAVLLTEGLEPRSHGGVIHYLNLRFVRPGRFPARQARMLSRLQSDRQDADYDRAALFTRETAREVLEIALEFAEACQGFLESEGFLPADD